MKTPVRSLALTLFAILALGNAVPAAADDFGVWTEVEGEKKISKRFSVDAGIDYRAEQQLKQTSRWGVTVGFNYKPTRFLKLSGGYAFIRDHYPYESKVNYTNKGRVNGYNVDNSFWRSKHRAYFDVTGKKRLGRFTLSLRERLQYTHFMSADYSRDRYRDALQVGQVPDAIYPWAGTDYTSLETVDQHKGNKNTLYLRSRLALEYNIRHCPLTPYASYEFSNNLCDGMHLDKTRLTVGTEWSITKQHSLSLAYVYQNGHDDDSDSDIHVISVGYGFKF